MADISKDQSGLTPKDVVIVLPFFASALAICWEVGSFLPIGGSFSLFSLSEHLLFALPALPPALAMTGLLGIYSLTIRTVARRWLARRRVRKPLQARRERRWIRSGLVALYLVAGFLFWNGLVLKSANFLVISIGVFCFALVASLSFKAILTPTATLVGGCFGFLFAMALGFDSTRNSLTRTDRLTDIVMDGQSRKALIVRAGERGFLVFDPSTSVFSFLKQDAVRSLNWERHPAFRFSLPSSP